MFNTERKSLMDVILAEEERNLIESIDLQFISDTANFHDGNILFTTLTKRTSFINLIARSKVVTKRDLKKAVEHRTWDNLFKDVTHNIITIDKMLTFEQAINTINDLYLALGSTFYGVLLISEARNIRINPLHPLTAMSMISEDKLQTKEWTVAIYSYRNRELMDEYYNTSDADTSIIEENLKDIINCYANRVESEIKIENQQYNSTTKKVIVDFKIRKHPDEEYDSKLQLIAHQILTSGTIAPYYGTSAIKTKSTGSSNTVNGTPVSPMLSSNISCVVNKYNYDYHKPLEEVKVEYGAVCTGTLDKYTSKGLRSLTHSNTKSPYINSIIQSGALAYVDACIAKSLEIYTLAKIIKPKESSNESKLPNNNNTTKTTNETSNTANN